MPLWYKRSRKSVLTHNTSDYCPRSLDAQAMAQHCRRAATRNARAEPSTPVARTLEPFLYRTFNPTHIHYASDFTGINSGAYAIRRIFPTAHIEQHWLSDEHHLTRRFLVGQHEREIDQSIRVCVLSYIKKVVVVCSSISSR